MSATKENIENLWKLYLSDQASPEEVQALFYHIRESSNDDINSYFYQKVVGVYSPTEKPDPVLAASILQSLLESVSSEKETITIGGEKEIHIGPEHRIHFLRRWGWAAASVIVLLGLATYLFINKESDQPLIANTTSLKAEVLPGGNRAILTLSDGTSIALDSAANGAIAHDGGAAIVKLADGRIAYHSNGVAEEKVLFNTIATPRGGQYQILLPDGTQVWLNAASSLTYPAVFTGKERRVKVNGEVYFEVAKNKEKPFIVDAADQFSIEVLGTNFNVNSYADDGSMKTTLINGSVKVFSGLLTAGDQINSVIIKPGEQAVAAFQRPGKPISKIEAIQKADIDKVMAWKNGVFNFDGMSLEEAMKQVERWYDLQVIYEKNIPDIRFYGKINRDLPLSELLKALKETEIHFRIEENRRLVILP